MAKRQAKVSLPGAPATLLPPTLNPESRATQTCLSAEHGNRVHWDIWSIVQRGLVYPAPHAIFLMCWRLPNPSTKLSHDLLCVLMHDLKAFIYTNFGTDNTTAIAAVGFSLWLQWCQEDGSQLHVPSGMKFSYPLKPNDPTISSVAQLSNGVYADSQGDLLFHIKSDEASNCTQVCEFIKNRLEVELQAVSSVSQETATKSTTPDKKGGKVLGCRFSENLQNPTDPVTMQEHIIVGFEDVHHIGSSFVVVQRFMLRWESLLEMSPTQFQDIVGRTFDDTMVPSRDKCSHIKCSRVQNDAGSTTKVLRLGLPFGRSPELDTDFGRARGASLRDEQGLYFAGFAKSATILEAVMRHQIGDDPAMAMRDRLLSNARSNLGGFFYIPNVLELKHEPLSLIRVTSGWARFPGVDWSRLDRHFTVRSSNGYMYYNHKDYLYAMSTMAGKDRNTYLPPSNRILRLLTDMFSLWEDNWYFDRAQPELEHLEVYLKKYFSEKDAEQIMSLPVVERMGYAVRISLGYVFVSPEYGYRGPHDTPQGPQCGADTYRIHPVELIVGALPNLSLGQGKYVIDYFRQDEIIKGFFSGITHASGIGHVVPDFHHLLDVGLQGLLEEVDSKSKEPERTETQRQFYRAVTTALTGVQEHMLAYSKLAKEMAAIMSAGQLAEKHNLEIIAERMQRLSIQKPTTMLDAAQLLFTFHSCLHLIGEPTAIGRIDQLLYPFYQKDIDAGRIDEEHAQEIIDAFWIKVGEKVQLNRMFVQDHQPYGNLAMGGSSGSYPQGSATNQWVQQMTVGGTIADDASGDGKPAYNTITLLCLRAARRLPLNAPCLTLRIRKDIPDEYLQEAALAILSGGAHPCFLSDEKIIPGLVKSGEKIGQGIKPTEFTPVAEKAAGLWSSEVSLVTARNYAADGCYEPQLTSCSWFTLGGFTGLSALEAALNQGKSWATAGPIYFRGQTVSLTTVPPKEITSFEQVVQLFFSHLQWMYSKAVNSTIAIFGDMASSCPTPLLSALTNDCLEKGLDLYGGGARYNVFAPCFTGMPNTINSLYAIKKLVFDQDSAITSLPELVQALICNWGHSMQEPFVSTMAGSARSEALAERYRNMREAALALPKYGRGNKEVDEFGNMILQRLAETVVKVFTEPVDPIAQNMVEAAKRLGTLKHPFGGFQIQPGVGTFDVFVDFGASCGASADGRLNGQTLASNISPTPSPQDLPVEHQTAPFATVLTGYTGSGTEAIWDGAPTDFNVTEDFPVAELLALLRAFADGAGSNILTITCANPETMSGAKKNPEKYDILRVRMGGWSDFFIATFPEQQKQLQRRPINTSLPIMPVVDDVPGKRVRIV